MTSLVPPDADWVPRFTGPRHHLVLPEISVRTMSDVADESYDLWFDPNSVGGDMVAECWISHGPRADDATFDPAPGDFLTVGGGDDALLRAGVVRRQGDRVTVQVELSADSAAVA